MRRLAWGFRFRLDENRRLRLGNCRRWRWSRCWGLWFYFWCRWVALGRCRFGGWCFILNDQLGCCNPGRPVLIWLVFQKVKCCSTASQSDCEKCENKRFLAHGLLWSRYFVCWGVATPRSGKLSQVERVHTVAGSIIRVHQAQLYLKFGFKSKVSPVSILRAQKLWRAW